VRIQKEVNEIIGNISVFFGGNFSPRRKEDTEEEWKAANGEQKRNLAQRRRDAVGKRKGGSHEGAETRRERKSGK
jgi:hypothetical protein